MPVGLPSGQRCSMTTFAITGLEACKIMRNQCTRLPSSTPFSVEIALEYSDTVGAGTLHFGVSLTIPRSIELQLRTRRRSTCTPPCITSPTLDSRSRTELHTRQLKRIG